MKQKHHKSFEEALQEKFDSFEPEVKPDFWSQIETQLPSGASSAVSGLSAATKGWMVAAAVVVTGAAIVGVNQLTQSTVQEQTQTEVVVPVQEIQKPIHVEGQEAQPEEVVNERLTTVQHERGDTHSTSNTSTEEVKPDQSQDTQKAERPRISTQQEETDLAESNGATSSEASEENEHALFDWDDAKRKSLVASPISGNAPLNVSFKSFDAVSKVQWDFGDGSSSSNEVNPEHAFETPGLYTVTMIAQRTDGSFYIDKTTVEVLEKSETRTEDLAHPSNIQVPNVFSPNFDGINDTWFAQVENIKRFNVIIFNRGGRVIFESSNAEERWDGRDMNGEMCPEGVYYYQITARGIDGNLYAPKGFVNIMR